MKKEIEKMDANELRRYIQNEMIDAGYDHEQIKFFLAGATLLGYLSDDRASWARGFLVRKYIAGLDPFDSRIEQAGETRINWKEWDRRASVADRDAQEVARMSRRADKARQRKLDSMPRPCEPDA